jgi:uncharacterized protein (TIGR02757 family)
LIDPQLPAEDGELWSFLVAGLSYGRVEQIKKSSLALLQALGLSRDGTGIRDAILSGVRVQSQWKHRLNNSADIDATLRMLSGTLSKHQSLASLFSHFSHQSPQDQLQSFVSALREKIPPAGRSVVLGTGAEWFCSSPRDGSTCKRLLMWLRWMVRKDHRDPGFWLNPSLYIEGQQLPLASRLFCPVDTHIFQWAQTHDIVQTKNPTWKSVLEITEAFRKRDPHDPLRWDFEISHQGMGRVRESKKGGKPQRVLPRPRSRSNSL